MDHQLMKNYWDKNQFDSNSKPFRENSMYFSHNTIWDTKEADKFNHFVCKTKCNCDCKCNKN